jgi:hypothetical protein
MLKNFFLISMTFYLFLSLNSKGQVLELSSFQKKIVIDDFSEFTSNPTLYAATTLSFTYAAPLAGHWDLVAESFAFNDNTYSTQGTAAAGAADPFDEEDIKIRAFNECNTPDIDYDISGVSPNINHLSSTLFRNIGATGTEKYIVGNLAARGNTPGDIGSPCAGAPINSTGSPSSDPQSHTFRIDFELDFSNFPATVMTPGFYTYTVNFKAYDDANPGTQIGNTVSFSLEIEILPVLQMNISSLQNIDFSFSDINKYISGAIKYGATKMEVNSNLQWDLTAIGSSFTNDQSSGLSPFWDIIASYSSNPGGSSNIPLSALEIFQNQPNPQPGAGAGARDYSANFTTPPSGNNNIEVATGYLSFLPVALSGSNLEKSIAGSIDPLFPSSMGPGSYIIDGGGAWVREQFSYTISYRLTPGLPATFANGAPLIAPLYANPGSYSMRVKFILTEDQ